MPRRRVVETDLFAGAVERMVSALGVRAASNLVYLRDLDRVRRHAEVVTLRAVRCLRADGHSFADVAAQLGVTRQAVSQRFGGRDE